MPLPCGVELYIERELGVKKGSIVYLIEIRKCGLYSGQLIGYKSPKTQLVKCFPEKGRRIHPGTFSHVQSFPIALRYDEMQWVKKKAEA